MIGLILLPSVILIGIVMTAQIADTFLYKNENYSLLGIKGGSLISPQQFGMEPVRLSTACYRGFYGTYELTEEALFLKELTLAEKNGNYLPIQGIKPEKSDYQATYHDLNIVVQFTGRIRLARDFIQELYIHMGYQKPTAFKTVYDITLKEGRVTNVKDRSKEIAQKRGNCKKNYESGNTIERIEDAFILDMD
jgi:hypothetical protein